MEKSKNSLHKLVDSGENNKITCNILKPKDRAENTPSFMDAFEPQCLRQIYIKHYQLSRTQNKYNNNAVVVVISVVRL
jgi:hypothetical protein